MSARIVLEDLREDSQPGSSIESSMHALGFADWQTAAERLRRIARVSAAEREPLNKLLHHLGPALSACADPDQALMNMERFLDGGHRLEALQQLAENPRALEILMTVFAGSQFLAEILVQNPRHLNVLLDRDRLAHRNESRDFEKAAAQAVAGVGLKDQPDRLRTFQRGELLRIGTCDLLDLFDLPAVTSQLSRLADGLIAACLAYAVARTKIRSDKFVVVAMGKLGGEELNYSSDIDLLFVCSEGAGEYLRLGQELIEALAAMTSHGFLYRVDMRLRPWGRDGALVSTIDSFVGYLGQHAQLWEKQALLKARPIAGNLELGRALLAAAEPHLFDHAPEEVRASVYAMKQRTERVLQEGGREWGEVKLGEGSIRDVEFVIQYLQLAFGRQYPDVRSPTTLQALPLLARRGLLTAGELRILTDGYVFLRTIEHYLQMMHYQQTHALPNGPAAMQLLARRLGFQGAGAGTRFVERYEQHCQAIRGVYLRYVGNEPPPLPEQVGSDHIRQHLARMDVSYADTFTPDEIERHAALALRLDDQNPVVVDPVRLGERTWQVTIVGYDYPGELSIICGLFFVSGFDISEGNVFTYEPGTGGAAASEDRPATKTKRSRRPRGSSVRVESPPDEDRDRLRQKIVDVFTVKSVLADPPDAGSWDGYSEDLRRLVDMMRSGQRREARGQLAKRVGMVFQAAPETTAPLYPIDIEVDNVASSRYTVLRIDAPDTVGFLYELTNALAFTQTYVARMTVSSAGNHARDILYVTDGAGEKITAPEKQRELRAAVVLIKHFTHLLPRSPNPEAALLHFREFIYQLFQRPNWPDEIASIERSDVLAALARVLGGSEFLWDDFLRMQYANLFPVVRNVDALAATKSRSQMQAELQTALAGAGGTPGVAEWSTALNAFKDRELFRIDMRHLLALTQEFWDFAAELTDLAEVVVSAAVARCLAELQGAFGLPILPDGNACTLSVLALGKCGGRELGFASDIELMFVYAGNGRTDGASSIDNADFHERLVHDVVEIIHARQEGIFHVDLQLRPYGKAGSLAVSLETFRQYYAPDGPAWAYERQALVKMRPIAGEQSLGLELAALRDTYTYHAGGFDVTAMRAMRERQIRHLVGAGTFNAKFSPGGLVDIEYLIQGLQINHGAADRNLRSTNLREAMSALAAAGILEAEDHTRLRRAHTFLRWLIDSLRVVRGNAKDVTMPPYGGEEYAFLARRLLYENDLDRLRDDLARYVTEVLEINQRLLPD